MISFEFIVLKSCHLILWALPVCSFCVDHHKWPFLVYVGQYLSAYSGKLPSLVLHFLLHILFVLHPNVCVDWLGNIHCNCEIVYWGGKFDSLLSLDPVTVFKNLELKLLFISLWRSSKLYVCLQLWVLFVSSDYKVMVGLFLNFLAFISLN